MKRIISLIIAFALLVTMLFSLSACTGKNSDMLTSVNFEEETISDFYIELFKESQQIGKNTVISPLSVLYAVAMVANGADGETLKQIEDMLGMSLETLNANLYAYSRSLAQNQDENLKLANSIWINNEKNSLEISKDFINKNKECYDAEVFNKAFNEETLNQINNWIDNNTDGIIKNMLNQIDSDALMYLINGLVFDASWQNEFFEHTIRNGDFTLSNGQTKSVEFMHSMENQYLEDENATGFIKHYKDSKYAFVALLPNEDVTIDEYIDGMTGKGITQLINNAKAVSVDIALPKFECEYEADMVNILNRMGMVNAFKPDVADFSRITNSENDIFVSKVLHKTKISVTPKGTAGGAATVIVLTDGACEPTKSEEIKRVHLNRPFVYMLIDCENNIPVFMGTVNDINA